MKRSLFLLIALFTFVSTWAQTTRIVNCQPGATGGVNVYTGATALADAVAASVTGDILQIVAGTVSAGDIVIAGKGLTIIGVGLDPDKDLGTRSLVGNITLNAGTPGTRISGVHMGILWLAQTGSSYTISNILVENTELKAVTAFSGSNAVGNFIVRNSVFLSAPGFTSNPVIEFFTNSGVLITNNIIRDRMTTPGTIKGDGLTVTNNLFYGNGAAGWVFAGLTNSLVQNNIFARVSGNVSANAANTGNTLKNNLVFGSMDNNFANGTNGNSTTGGIVADPLMVNLPATNATWVYTNNITLQAGSSAINAGLDGTNIGPTGGITPFDDEGTLLPLIQSIIVPTIVTKGVDLQVTVKAKGN